MSDRKPRPTKHYHFVIFKRSDSNLRNSNPDYGLAVECRDIGEVDKRAEFWEKFKPAKVRTVLTDIKKYEIIVYDDYLNPKGVLRTDSLEEFQDPKYQLITKYREA